MMISALKEIYIEVDVVKGNTTERHLLYKVVKARLFYYKQWGTSNSWSSSTLNTDTLNGTYLTGLGSWADYIETVAWKTGGNTVANIIDAAPINVVYTNEITSPASNETYNAKIGLLYASDFSYGVAEEYWPVSLDNYGTYELSFYNYLSNPEDSNHYEWTITKVSNSTGVIAFGNYGRGVQEKQPDDNYVKYRPAFYLKNDVFIDKTGHTGSEEDPYRIG